MNANVCNQNFKSIACGACGTTAIPAVEATGQEKLIFLREGKLFNNLAAVQLIIENGFNCPYCGQRNELPTEE